MIIPNTSSSIIAVPHAIKPPKPRSTITQTQTITITLPENLSSSLVPHTRVATSFQWPVTHGIVPGPTRESNSQPSTKSSSGCRSTSPSFQTLPKSIAVPLRHSSFPRPRSPGFLYPEPIYPRQATMAPNSSNNNVIWYLPYGMEVVIFVILGLGLAWTVLVCLIHFPPRMWRERRKRRGIESSGEAAKDTKGYVEGEGEKEVGKTTGMILRGNEVAEQGSGLKYRYACSDSCPVTDGASQSSSRRNKAAESPLNPFLYPPDHEFLERRPSRNLRTRTSSEWRRQHAAFFSTSDSSSRPLSLHGSPERDDEGYDCEYDMGALEAGTPQSTPRGVSMKIHRNNLNWVDLGLERVEEAVSGLVGKVARWTDDESGREGEGVLLPIANSKQGVKVE